MAHHSRSTLIIAADPANKSKTQQPSPKSLAFFAVTANPASTYISPYAQNLDIPAPSQPDSTSTSINPNIKELSSQENSEPFAHASKSSSSPEILVPNSSSGKMSSSQMISANEKAQLIRSLQTHKINTIIELRRIEKIFASLNTADVTEPMTSAWAHYVNSNNLLSELRGITKNYPFSSECLDEAKWQVIGDPSSTRSWNYCWLVLTKIRKEGLIARHARLLAAKPAMWGGRTPTAAGVEKLATACVGEWTRALDQMLRHWTSPPSVSGQ